MITPKSYYTVQAWMVNDLGLHGNELALYAIIYGFSQDGRSAFAGSIAYIMEWLGCSRNTAIKSVAALVEKGLIIKKASTNGVDTNIYKVKLDLINGSVNSAPGVVQKLHPGSANSAPGVVQKLHPGSANSAPGVVQKLHPGSANSAPNNYIDNYIYNNIDNNGESVEPPTGEIEKDKKQLKHKHGEYQNVLLTDEEHKKLSAVFPDLPARIERLSEYIASTGKRYKSHYATIRSWANRDRQQRPAARPAGRGQATGMAIDQTKTDLDGYR